MQSNGETVLFKGLAAEVQLTRRAGSPPPGMPTDVLSASGFDIYIPNLAQKADILRGDIVTDDLGHRYEVMGPYWNVLGWKLSTLRLDA